MLWNHRWEYDKAPEVFAAAIEILVAKGIDFGLALLGSRPASVPSPLHQLRERAPEHIRYDGKLSRTDYEAVLGESTIVVSTAAHEFQGLSVMEACSAGARPLVPDALCYPEFYPAEYRYPAGDAAALAARLQDWLEDGPPPPRDTSAWHADALLPAWRRELERLVSCRA